ncbi:response regulator [bacterium 1xD8-6]|nr:response regulator [bacterium D16-36]RKI66320.1 response regulator [bacterium 1xD8-6]
MNDEGKKRIMIVDDSAVMLRSMKGILDRTYTVYLSTSGKQALQAIPEKQPDLVLLDYKMPEMDGIAVLEAMRADDSMKDIPIVFLTSVADRKTVDSILRLKPAGYILKPPDQSKVLETIKEALRRA